MKTCVNCAGGLAMSACKVCNGSGKLCSAIEEDKRHVFASATCGLGTAQLSDDSLRALPGFLTDERSDLIAECPRLIETRDRLVAQLVQQYGYSVIQTVSRVIQHQ